MKKVILIILSLVLTSPVILWTKGNTMREIKTEIEIAAPPSTVWNILMNFEDWKSWNPLIIQASGKAFPGAELTILMYDKNGKNGPKYKPVIIDFKVEKYFRWRAKMMTEILMTNDKIFELEETASGTKLIHKEMFSGMMVPLMWGQFTKGVPPMLNSMNSALKTLAEKSLK